MMSSTTKRRVIAISVALLVIGLVVGAVIGMYTVPPKEVKEVETITATSTARELVTTTREVPKEVTRTTTEELVTTTTVREVTTTTKEVPKEVVKEVTKEVLMKLPVLAEKIRKGEIDVGEVYGMAPGQRYHRIHAEVIGLECSSCHVEEIAPEMVFAQEPSGAPGPVDRRICLGCHLAGPASNLYGP